MRQVETFFPEGWFPVATNRELGRKPIRRVLCGVPLVLYRDQTGAPVALHDRCPHRHAPLSDGRVINGEIECPYHGWRFNSTGRCTASPSMTATCRTASSRDWLPSSSMVSSSFGAGDGDGRITRLLGGWDAR